MEDLHEQQIKHYEQVSRRGLDCKCSSETPGDIIRFLLLSFGRIILVLSHQSSQRNYNAHSFGIRHCDGMWINLWFPTSIWKDRVTKKEAEHWLEKKGQRKKSTLAWTCDMDGPPAQTTASTVLRGYGIQVRIRSASTETDSILTR